MYEIFEQLLNSFNISAYKFCKDTGVSQSTISTWNV
nr:MAG TPA: regulatory protein [Caudoviricetes sp.]